MSPLIYIGNVNSNTVRILAKVMQGMNPVVKAKVK